MTRAGRLAAGALACALALAACGSGAPEPVREPHAVEDPPPEVDTDPLWLPTQFEALDVVDPGWASAPQGADGVFIGASERDGVLEFTAVDVHGDVLWAAQRPASCSGFAVTRDADGEALVVLMDVVSTAEALAEVTATAYELSTGAQVWGPVEVPGPYQGPGLVFAAPPENFMGESGARVALDPSTGAALAVEGTSGPGRVIGEYEGAVLLLADEAVVALDAGAERWRLPLAEHGWSDVRASVAPAPTGMAVLDVGDDRAVLIDVDDGAIVSESVDDVGVDSSTGTLVLIDGATMRALGADGQELWALSVSPETRIAAVGGVFVYLREGGAVRVHNVLTGAVAQAYDPAGTGAIVVPTSITATGAAVLVHERRYLLATVDAPPQH